MKTGISRTLPSGPAKLTVRGCCAPHQSSGGVDISRLFKRLFSGFLGTSETTHGVKLGAFGKHPAFDDHLDDSGLTSAALIDARRILYADAIRANIDSGAWERLEPSQRIEAFDHTFLWSLSRKDDILLTGRLLPSRDAKGRDKYPLALVAEMRDAHAIGAIPAAIRRLDALADETAAITTRGEFAAAMDVARSNAGSIMFLGDAVPPVDELIAGFATAGDMQHECLARCLYAIQRELSSVADRQTASGTGHVRLPVPEFDDAQALTAWLALIHRWLPDLRGVLLIKPRAQPWVDALVPIPLPAQLACIRIGTSLVPLACDVPYSLDPSILQRARDLAGAPS